MSRAVRVKTWQSPLEVLHAPDPRLSPPHLEDGRDVTEVQVDAPRREKGQVSRPPAERSDLPPPLGGQPARSCEPPRRPIALAIARTSIGRI
jgi:hypothetical protein